MIIIITNNITVGAAFRSFADECLFLNTFLHTAKTSRKRPLFPVSEPAFGWADVTRLLDRWAVRGVGGTRGRGSQRAAKELKESEFTGQDFRSRSEPIITIVFSFLY